MVIFCRPCAGRLAAFIGNFIKQKETYLTELSLRRIDNQSSNSPQTQPSIAVDKPITEVVYEITYTPLREVLLNKTFQLAKPDFATENDLVFSYLYKNPNQKFTKQQLEEAIDKKLTKNLHKIVENLGFKSDLRKMFFNVSRTSISFKNPITKTDLEALEIQKIKIS